MSHARKISVTGLGYVGLPVAVAFGLQGAVVAFDENPGRVEELRRGVDHTGEVGAAQLAKADLRYTTTPVDLRAADFHIVAVPTPVDADNRPDLGPLERASTSVGSALKPGGIVVFESTVYPGATEEVCVPLLEAASGLRHGSDFHVGYSPERINPGDREHGLASIVKVVAGDTAETLRTVAEVYRSVIEAGVFEAASIRVAEAAKAIENTQRDLNIALMNELAMVFDRLNIDTGDVIEAAATKWNFVRFTPGLVGGHCIGVDPYYLTYRAAAAGCSPQVILAGRGTNDGMAGFLARRLLSELRSGGNDDRPRVTLLGFTFKENVPDTRNTQAADLVRSLEHGGAGVQVHDPLADPAEAMKEYGIRLQQLEQLQPADAVIVAVPHKPYREGNWALVIGLLRSGRGIVYDLKGILDRNARPEGVKLLRL